MHCDDPVSPTHKQYEVVRLKLERYASRLIERYRELFWIINVDAADLASEAILKFIKNKKGQYGDINEQLPYLYRTVYTIAMDYIREVLRDRDHFECIPDWMRQHEQDQADHEDCIRNYRLSRFKKIRHVLNLVQSKPKAGHIDYFAVFILQLRLTMLHLIQKVWHDLQWHVDETDPRDLAQRIFQWTSDDEVRVIKEGCPDLRSIWETMRTLPMQSKSGETEMFLSAMATISGERFQLSATQWYTQVKRAKMIIRERMGEPDWHLHFSIFFPDKHSRDHFPGKGGTS